MASPARRLSAQRLKHLQHPRTAGLSGDRGDCSNPPESRCGSGPSGWRATARSTPATRSSSGKRAEKDSNLMV